MKKTILISLSVLFLSACSSVKIIEKNSNGGTLKFKRRGITKNLREDKAMSEADEHCKRNGFKTYQVNKEVQDGRFLQVQFSCVN